MPVKTIKLDGKQTDSGMLRKKEKKKNQDAVKNQETNRARAQTRDKIVLA